MSSILTFRQLLSKRFLVLIVLAATFSIAAICTLEKPTYAISASDFNAGRIIDDAIFTNNGSMDVNSIQSFLNSKVSSCDTNGTQRSEMNNSGVPDYNGNGVIERWEWGKAKYNQTTFPCLRDYTDNNVSAAQIIYNAAQKYKINPQVLIVLLQKEQGLVTDTWPLAVQYRTATGYGCPDTAACDSTYYGLTNQINWAATMFRAVLNQSPTWYSPYILGNNYIQWNPEASCGGSTVNIENLSTVALYDYTPYRPNQAALDAGYGGPVTCGAYGNRNFFLYFNDWFGSTRGVDYQWQVVSQEYYTDATKTTQTSSNIPPNGSIHLVLKAKNTGNATWSNSTYPINLATLPSGHDSVFCGAGWLSCNRPTRLIEASVAPGGIGTFEFDVYNPGNVSGVYREYVSLVAEGKAWFNNPAANFYLTPQPAQYTWNIAGQQAYTDSTMATPKDMWSIRPGENAYLVIKAKNTGNFTWTKNGANPIHLATSWPYDRNSAIYNASWLGTNRPAVMTEDSVAPGQVATFAFPVTMPAKAGSYIEHFNLVSEGKSWFNDTGINYYIKVQPDIYTWNIAGQQAYTDSTMATPKDMWSIKPGQSAYLVIKAKNTGNVTWTSTGTNPIHLATSRGNDRPSVISTPTWYSFNRPATMSEPTVAPGQIGTFSFPVTMPTQPGSYIEYFNLVAEGKAWLNDTGLNYYIKSY